MFPSRLPYLFFCSVLLAASCDLTPTPAPLGEPEILAPDDGELVQLYQTIEWRVQAHSQVPVTGFGITRCNSDDQLGWLQIDSTGSAGSNGTAYFSEQDMDGLLLEPGPCTIKVSSIDTSNENGPFTPLTLAVADPPTVDSILMEILSPASGEVIPLDSDYMVRLRAVSTAAVIMFEWQICVFPGDTFAMKPDSKGELGINGFPYLLDQEIPDLENQPSGPCSLRARAITGGSEVQASEWEEVHFFLGESLMQVTPASLLPLPPTPTPTLHFDPVILFTDTPAGSFQAAAKMNANCRAGPGTAHNELGYARQGDVVEVVGRNEDATWLQVVNPHAVGRCWISILALDIPFDINALPVAAYPTPPPVEEEGCLVTSAATGGQTCVAPCPAGASPGTACTP